MHISKNELYLYLYLFLYFLIPPPQDQKYLTNLQKFFYFPLYTFLKFLLTLNIFLLLLCIFHLYSYYESPYEVILRFRWSLLIKEYFSHLYLRKSHLRILYFNIHWLS
ncbi:hypothetical protein CKR_1650 [Clostridium kluyveri NBRC 12016]|uniref:Uncharacterized protein n=1 Tax=Clostridium kluyveri (strain NBRC 12016) TaxID=583346 RepID=B9E2H6_CLOK1|nr:hypothetical protein CKR_1650 [Clostridium kluyveri NBRC 12016]